MAERDASTVFGVDLVRGSADSGEAPQYALSVLREDWVEQLRVSRHKLLRLISEQAPDVVAVDSYTELAPDRKGLVRLLRRLPPHTRLVQVTGAGGGPGLPRLAAEHGIRVDARDPMDESLACALLARRGVGVEVSPFEDVVRVKVSRARALGRGGWSQNRYRRRVQGAVRGAVRDVEAALAGLDYELQVQEGFGGLVHGVFTVRAPRRAVPVQSRRTGDVQIAVDAREREALEFIPVQPRCRAPIIVGVDPGTTRGVAVVDLDGKVMEVTSKRNASFEELVELAGRHGQPLVVACDVSPTPGLVERLKRAYGAELWSPPFAPLSVDEKKELTRSHDPANDHQRDALAAALKAHRSLRNKLEQAAQRAPPWADLDELRSRVVRGQSIDEAIAATGRPQAPARRPIPHSAPPVPASADVDALRAQVREKDEQARHLRAYLDELRAELASARSRCDGLAAKLRREVVAELARTRRDQEFRAMQANLRRLRRERDAAREEAARLRETLERVHRAEEMRSPPAGMLPVKVLVSFTREGLDALSAGVGLHPGDVVYIASSGGGGVAVAGRLAEAGVAAVVSSGDLSHLVAERLFEADVPLLDAGDVGLAVEGELAHADPRAMERAEQKWRQLARERRTDEKRRWLDSLVAEYRHDRQKDG